MSPSPKGPVRWSSEPKEQSLLCALDRGSSVVQDPPLALRHSLYHQNLPSQALGQAMLPGPIINSPGLGSRGESQTHRVQRKQPVVQRPRSHPQLVWRCLAVGGRERPGILLSVIVQAPIQKPCEHKSSEHHLPHHQCWLARLSCNPASWARVTSDHPSSR